MQNCFSTEQTKLIFKSATKIEQYYCYGPILQSAEGRGAVPSISANACLLAIAAAMVGGVKGNVIVCLWRIV